VSSVASLDLSALPESASRARRLVADAIGDEREDDELREVAVLLVSELVANAVLHAGTPCVVLVDVNDRRVRVEVRDEDPRLPAMKDYGLDAVTGRGLRIVDSLSDRWGADGDERGKTVWFEIDRDSRGRA
jgi:anti-sigma regulatory factor (Ser/Thr protein kinase)